MSISVADKVVFKDHSRVGGKAKLPLSRYVDACTCFAAQRELRPPRIRGINL